jgi:hypothetical protein
MSDPTLLLLELKIKNPKYRQCIVNLLSDRPLCTLSISLSFATY